MVVLFWSCCFCFPVFQSLFLNLRLVGLSLCFWNKIALWLKKKKRHILKNLGKAITIYERLNQDGRMEECRIKQLKKKKKKNRKKLREEKTSWSTAKKTRCSSHRTIRHFLQNGTPDLFKMKCLKFTNRCSI